MKTLIIPLAAALSLAAPPARAAAQHWKQIGVTSAGNVVYVDPASVHTVSGIIHARVRVKFTTPVQTPQGSWKTSQTLAMFDCAKHTFAAKENTYYIDEATNKIAERSVAKIPGYGPALKGSLSQVAMDYFCKP
jgi:hypothetical protein